MPRSTQGAAPAFRTAYYLGSDLLFCLAEPQPLSVSQYRLAKAIDVPARRINEIVHGQRRITADTALRLSRYFGTSERFWLNLQARYDLETEQDRLGTELDDIHPLSSAS